jgi:hypothetical protein
LRGFLGLSAPFKGLSTAFQGLSKVLKELFMCLLTALEGLLIKGSLRFLDPESSFEKKYCELSL